MYTVTKIEALSDKEQSPLNPTMAHKMLNKSMYLYMYLLTALWGNPFVFRVLSLAVQKLGRA